MATNDPANREKEIFEKALELASPEERLGYLKGTCAGDAELLARVQALLRANDSASQFLPEDPTKIVLSNTVAPYSPTEGEGRLQTIKIRRPRARSRA